MATRTIPQAPVRLVRSDGNCHHGVSSLGFVEPVTTFFGRITGRPEKGGEIAAIKGEA